MSRTLGTLALVLGLAASASAQDGGKLSWKGKGSEDPKTAMVDANRRGVPMLLFFTSEGSQPAKNLSAGAFSDPAVVEASSRYACVFVDCAWGKKNQEISDRYQISGYPTVYLCNSEGKVLAEVKTLEPAAVARQLNDVSARARDTKGPIETRPPAADPAKVLANLEKLIQQARSIPKPVLIFFYDESPPSTTTGQSLADPLLQETLAKFVVAKTEYHKDSPVSAKFDLSRVPTVLLLNPMLKKPEEKPIDRISGSRTPRELQRDLESALSGLKLGPPQASEAPGAGPATKSAPEEKLSDDQVERQFILARMAIAQDLAKSGKKDKAIAILEDLLQTYPKHVLTKDVRKQIEDLRK